MAAGRIGGSEPTAWARLTGLARVVIKYWALAGGVILLALVLMTAAGAASNLAFGRPFPFDYDLARHGVAIAAFTFLPYCQLTYGNVTVDVFTERAGDRAKAAMVVLASLMAVAFAVLMLRQMWLGMLDYIEYREVMVSLRVPLWTAFPPALVSLALMLVAALITAAEGIRGVRGEAVAFSHDVPDRP
jgi:TRAP-type C4-dicarboxylate transport system permease small subunit